MALSEFNGMHLYITYSIDDELFHGILQNSRSDETFSGDSPGSIKHQTCQHLLDAGTKGMALEIHHNYHLSAVE